MPPGVAGVRTLLERLPSALDGSGPAIAPVPTTSMTVSTAVVTRVLAATRPDDPSLPLEDDACAVVLSTSGSTGDPRGVLLSAQALTALNDAVLGSSAPTWVVAIPVTSAGGLNVLMRALARDRDPVVLPSIGGGAPFTASLFADAVERALAAHSDVRTSLVAAQVRRILEDERGVEALRSCSMVLVGGGPLDAMTRMRADELGITLTATYGATETAGGCVYDGLPLDGVGIAIDQDEVIVSGPVLALGYRGDPHRTRERFTSAGFRTGDIGTIDDGLLRIIGRRDDQVSILGTNVSVLAVEAAALAVDGVGEAVAVAVPTATEPAIVVFVRIAEGFGSTAVRESLRHKVREQLGGPAVPREVVAVETVPSLPNGKPDRAALRAAALSILQEAAP